MLSLTVVACSIKTLYNRLDYLIPSYVEGMVSLDDVLEEIVEQRSFIEKTAVPHHILVVTVDDQHLGRWANLFAARAGCRR